jgi:hypothetical protein
MSSVRNMSVSAAAGRHDAVSNLPPSHPTAANTSHSHEH